MSLEMSGVEDSCIVSSDASDEEAGCYISIPKPPTDSTPCDLVIIEAPSVTFDLAQDGVPEHSIIVPSVQNGQQGSDQTFLSTHHKDILDASEHGDEIDGLDVRISVLEEKNETLGKKYETLEKQFKRLMEENQQLKAALAGHGIEQSKEEQFCSTASTQQLWRDGCAQEEVHSSVNTLAFQECSELQAMHGVHMALKIHTDMALVRTKDLDTYGECWNSVYIFVIAYERDLRGDSGSEGDCVVSQDASCNCKHLCNVQLTDHSNQTQAQNKHQVFVKSTTDSSVMCNCIVPHCKSRSDLNGDGVLIAILGPPCKTDGVPEKSIILKRTVPTNVQADACESMLLELAYQRAPGAKYCLLQTTFDNSSMLVNPGVTAEAISFLIANWPHWKIGHNLHTLIVIIPYGGKYKVDEEKAVNEAIRSGIIIVAASGWGGLGIAFPAKLGAVISVGATQCDGTLAPFSPVGRELDFVGLGSLKFGSVFIFGTGISTIGVATDLALLFQHFSCTQSALITYIGTYVVRELLEIIAGNVSATGKDVMAIIDLPEPQVRRYITQILCRRDRRAILSDPMQNDAQFNTKYWSSENINKQYKKEHKDFPHLSGKNITIAIIDEINEAFLHHLKDHSVEVHATTDGVKYFSFSGTMVCTECCAKHINVAGGHGLQCAAIIANTAPNCTILMIMRNDLDRSEKVALSIAMEQEADILMLSSVTTDTVHLDYLYNISAHLSCRIVLCAAGNEGNCDRTSTICYPSRAGDVIVIGACDCYGKNCPYSSCGRQVDFLSPGQFSIADSSGRGGTCYSTSAAAGLIALLLEYIDQKLSTAAKVEVWVSMEKEWKLQTLPSLARNTHLMRDLLSSSKLSLCQRIEHAVTEGFGMLLIDNLGMLTPDGISQVIANFHTEISSCRESQQLRCECKARTTLNH